MVLSWPRLQVAPIWHFMANTTNMSQWDYFLFQNQNNKADSMFLIDDNVASDEKAKSELVFLDVNEMK